MTTSKAKILDRDFSIDFCICGSTTNAHMFQCVAAAHEKIMRKLDYSQIKIEAITVPCQMLAAH